MIKRSGKIASFARLPRDPTSHPPCSICSRTSNNIHEKWRGKWLWLCYMCRKTIPLMERIEEEFNHRFER